MYYTPIVPLVAIKTAKTLALCGPFITYTDKVLLPGDFHSNAICCFPDAEARGGVTPLKLLQVQVGSHTPY